MLAAEAELVHLIMAGVAIVAPMAFKDVLMGIWKGQRWKKANHFQNGDKALISGDEVIVCGIDTYGITVRYSDDSVRIISASKIGSLDVRKIK